MLVSLRELVRKVCIARRFGRAGYHLGFQTSHQICRMSEGHSAGLQLPGSYYTILDVRIMAAPRESRQEYEDWSSLGQSLHSFTNFHQSLKKHGYKAKRVSQVEL